MKAQRGQSVTEFAVGASVLSLLLTGTLALTGYQEVDRRVAAGARQSAWAQEWTPDGHTVAQARALHRQHLSDVSVREPSGRALLVSEEDVTFELGALAPTGLAGAATDALRAPLRAASGFLGSEFDLGGQSLNHGSVAARVRPHSGIAPFNELDLQLRAPFALLGDAWHAAGPGHVRQRAAGLVPAQALRAFNSVWQPLAIPLGLLEPSLRELCFGLIEPERIPEHRLGPGITPAPGTCP